MIFSTLILAISIFPRSTRVAISRLAALASASRFSRIILMRCIESLRCRNDRRVESYRANQLTRDVESLCCRRTGFGPDGGRKNVCSTFKRRYNSCLRPRGTPRNHVDSKPDVVQGQPSPHHWRFWPGALMVALYSKLYLQKSSHLRLHTLVILLSSPKNMRL